MTIHHSAHRSEIDHALSYQVPDMETGFIIRTAYGDIPVYAHEAADFVQAAHVLMFRRLGLIPQAGAAQAGAPAAQQGGVQ